jgi:hypothetical protein
MKASTTFLSAIFKHVKPHSLTWKRNQHGFPSFQGMYHRFVALIAFTLGLLLPLFLHLNLGKDARKFLATDFSARNPDKIDVAAGVFIMCTFNQAF